MLQRICVGIFVEGESKMSNPMLSVIMPVYNKEKWIENTLHSVINQTFFDSEIIIIDDGSTDSSLEIVEKCDRIKVLKQKNKGASAARNVGIDTARGKYIIMLDADDTIEPNMHE